MVLPSDDRMELEEELRGLKDTLGVIQVVVSSLDLNEVVANILASAMGLVDVPAGSLALYDEASGNYELRTHRGHGDTFTIFDRWSEVLFARLSDAAAGEPVVVEDTDRDVRFEGSAERREGIRALIVVPLQIRSRRAGLLFLDDFVPRRFSEVRLRLLAILASFAAVSIENARLHKRTRDLACTDGLTGLYNHRQFKKMLSEELCRARRYGQSMSLLMFDIDDFKAFNDRYGHPAGDRVLMTVAEILSDSLRACDLTFRYGGEEFIVILPQSDRVAALVAAEHCRRRIAAESGRDLDRDQPHAVTVSVGVASYPQDAPNPEALLKVVDDLLYRAKSLGKNRVHHLP